jgi:hypothetical protein
LLAGPAQTLLDMKTALFVRKGLRELRAFVNNCRKGSILTPSLRPI